jgi:hypothetical protein
MVSMKTPPTPHRTETKKSETEQSEGAGFGDGCAVPICTIGPKPAQQ